MDVDMDDDDDGGGSLRWGGTYLYLSMFFFCVFGVRLLAAAAEDATAEPAEAQRTAQREQPCHRGVGSELAGGVFPCK